jgi:D-aminopeptidase
MMNRLESCLRSLPNAFPGPGGAVAVLKDGEVLLRHAWGYANAERRIPFTPRTLFRMCSITKQFTCGVVLSAFPDPAVLDDGVAATLPNLTQPPPKTLDLCHNQSGLRDYWAVAMLHGSPVEAPFGDAESARVFAGTRSLHFAPGTRFSYVNQNFRILSDVAQARTGRGFGELLRKTLFEPAGMESAFLAADTRAMPDGTQGYEGSVATGFRAAENNIFWTGDAGLGASLDDMIAWERFVDASRDDAQSIYSRLAAPVHFADGNTALYGFGLSRHPVCGRAATGHGGALRGWRSQRFYLPGERLSVVVMFNHMADAAAAARKLAAAALDEPAPPAAKDLPDPAWLGDYLVPETGLLARISRAAEDQVALAYSYPPELLPLHEDGTAGEDLSRLRPGPGGLWLDRPSENFSGVLLPLDHGETRDIAGRYHCVELDAALTITDSGGALYGAFSGFLGQGRMEQLHPVGGDIWTLPCPRALDHSPPGDWTLALQPDGALVVGCWLARGLRYERVSKRSLF